MKYFNNIIYLLMPQIVLNFEIISAPIAPICLGYPNKINMITHSPLILINEHIGEANAWEDFFLPILIRLSLVIK